MLGFFFKYKNHALIPLKIPSAPPIAASLEPPPPTYYISTHLDVPVYLSVGGPAGTVTAPSPTSLADTGHTFLSDFRNRLKLTAHFAVFFRFV